MTITLQSESNLQLVFALLLIEMIRDQFILVNVSNGLHFKCNQEEPEVCENLQASKYPKLLLHPTGIDACRFQFRIGKQKRNRLDLIESNFYMWMCRAMLLVILKGKKRLRNGGNVTEFVAELFEIAA